MNAFWSLVGVLASIGIFLIVAWKLTVLQHCFNFTERLGMGLGAGSCFLTIPAILDAPGNPFDHWAMALFRVGIFIYFIGRVQRFYKHKWRNEAMIAEYNDNLARRRA